MKTARRRDGAELAEKCRLLIQKYRNYRYLDLAERRCLHTLPPAADDDKATHPAPPQRRIAMAKPKPKPGKPKPGC